MERRHMSDKKTEIVQKAYDRFYDGGFHATGVDAVMADTGISKRTLYKYFGSKEELIEAVLAYYGAQIGESLFRPAQQFSNDPCEQIMAFFDIREEMISDRPIRGCLGIKASQEYIGKHDGIASAGKTFAKVVESTFTRLCEKAQFDEPALVGKEITILFQGAVLLSQVYGEPSPFHAAKSAAGVLLANAALEKRKAS
jgi:AcrR family transcriptional regulator